MKSCLSILFLAALLVPAQEEPARLPLRARLVLSKKFCATAKRQSLGLWDVLRPGPAACREFESELKAVFSEVTRVEAVPPGERSPDEVLLVPRFVEMSATKPLLPTSQRKLTILLEWTVQDPAGRTVWLQTVEGSSQDKLGWTSYPKKLVEKAVHELATASAAQMAAAPELKTLAK